MGEGFSRGNDDPTRTLANHSMHIASCGVAVVCNLHEDNMAECTDMMQGFGLKDQARFCKYTTS
jgi:hypothetical protein